MVADFWLSESNATGNPVFWPFESNAGGNPVGLKPEMVLEIM